MPRPFERRHRAHRIAHLAHALLTRGPHGGHVRTTLSILAVLALCTTACGGAQPQDANAEGDDHTGSRAETQGNLTTSGNELAENRDCSVEAVYFEYDSSELDTRARNTLDSDARCLTQ